jgi:hypothetical protein
MSRNRTLHRNRWLYLSSYNLIADPPVFGACRELDGPERRVTIPAPPDVSHDLGL